MLKIDSYILKKLLKITLLNLLILIVLEFCLSFLIELGDLNKSKNQLTRLVYHILMLQPKYACELFPISLLISSALCINNLDKCNELIILFISGLSPIRIMKTIINASLIMSIIITIFDEFIANPIEKIARTDFLLTDASLFSTNGFWVKDENCFIHIKSVLPELKLLNVIIFEFDSDFKIRSIIQATEGFLRKGNWLLSKAEKTNFSNNQVHSEYLNNFVITSVIKPKIIEVINAEPDKLSITDLLLYLDYLQINNTSNNIIDSVKLVIWKKLLNPINNISMLLFSIPVLFNIKNLNIGQRLIFSLFLGCLFLLINYILNSIELFYNLPNLVILITPMVMGLIGFIFYLLLNKYQIFGLEYQILKRLRTILTLKIY